MAAQIATILLLALAEGGALLAYQLVCAKLFAPWFGTSLEVWSAILGMTLAGLAVGYAWGAFLARRSVASRKVALHMVLASLFLLSLPWWHSFVQGLLSQLDLRLGAFLTALILISPVMMLLGTFSPLSISILQQLGYSAHRAAGIIFGTSTLGGVLWALMIGLSIAPTYGLAVSCYVLGCTLLTAVGIFAYSIPSR